MKYIDLGNEYLINWYGRWTPNLTFMCEKEIMKKYDFELLPRLPFTYKYTPLGIDGNGGWGANEVIYGSFYVGKKGTNCFRVLPRDKALHQLLKVNCARTPTEIEDAAIHSNIEILHPTHGSSWVVLPKDYTVQKVDY